MINKNTLLLSLFLCSSLSGFSERAKPVSECTCERVNFPSNFQVECGADIIVFADYLAWVAQEDDLYYAHTNGGGGTEVFPPNGNLDFTGRLKKVKPDWNNGLRIGVGFNFPRAGYDIMAYWTWFKTHGHNSKSTSKGNVLPLWAHPDFATTPTRAFSASGSWHLDFDTADLEWGRSSWFGGCFSLRPFFGVRGAWIDQRLKNRYEYTTDPVVRGKLLLDSDFHGAGLRAGGNARYVLPYDFAIYGIVSGSLLYGHVDAGMHFKEDHTTIAHTKDRYWKGISSLQIAAGLGWDTHFLEDRCHIEFHIGWEQNIWFNVNQMNHFLNDFHSGSFFKENSNLTLQGVVVGGRLDF